jgi:hypothetical protein
MTRTPLLQALRRGRRPPLCSAAPEHALNILESQWLGERIARIPSAELFPILNIGSSTLEFRTVSQPWIEQYIFEPIRARGGKVHHVDLKAAPGVDMAGDLLEPAFQQRVAALGARSVLALNILEHVVARRELCDFIAEIVPPGGYIIVSGPQQYPYHADPIDTMFRPTIREIVDSFPGTKLIDSAVIDSGNWRQWHAGERGRSLARAIVRLAVPIWKPRSWLIAARAPFLIRHITAFAVILKKE